MEGAHWALGHWEVEIKVPSLQGVVSLGHVGYLTPCLFPVGKLCNLRVSKKIADLRIYVSKLTSKLKQIQDF